MHLSDRGYVIIENHLSAKPSRGWQSAVELARNVPSEAFFSRGTTSRVNADRCGCFKFLTADFHPRLGCGIFGYGLCHH
jgi:hypothetical protein